MKTKPSFLIATLMAAVLTTFIIAGCKKNNPQAGTNGSTGSTGSTGTTVQKTYPFITLPDSVMFVGTSSVDSTIIYILNAATGSMITKYTHHPIAPTYQCVPLAGNGFLYAVEGNTINALNMNTGAVMWTDSIKNFYVQSPVLLHNDTFYGVYATGLNLGVMVYALDATKQSKTFLWQYPVSSNPTSVNYYNGIIYINDLNDGKLIALDAKTGILKWIMGNPYSLTSLNNGIIISGNTMIDATTGSQIGTVPASLVGTSGSQTSYLTYATKSWFVTRVTQFMTPYTTSQLNAYDVTTNALKWSINGGNSNPSNDTIRNVDQIWNNQPIVQTVYSLNAGKYGDVNSFGYSALDMNTGQQKWSYAAGFGGLNFVVNNTLYSYGTFTLNLAAGVPASMSLSAVDLNAGKQKWTVGNLPLIVGASIDVCVYAAGKGYSVYTQ